MVLLKVPRSHDLVLEFESEPARRRFLTKLEAFADGLRKALEMTPVYKYILKFASFVRIWEIEMFLQKRNAGCRGDQGEADQKTRGFLQGGVRSNIRAEVNINCIRNFPQK